MAQYGGDQMRQVDEYGNPIRQTDEYGNPVHHTGGTMGEYGTTGAAAGHGIGATGVGGEQKKVEQHDRGLGGKLHRSGSSSSSSSEDDGQGGRRKKKGIKDKIKDKLPGGHKDAQQQQIAYGEPTATGQGYGMDGEQHQEKKGIMDKIKEKLPGQHGRT